MDLNENTVTLTELRSEPTKALEASPGVTSIGRIGFTFCLVLAGVAALLQIFGPLVAKPMDHTALISVLLGFAFVGKVGQSFAEAQAK
jgi:hypothetical protein